MHHSTLKTLAGFLAVKEREETREMREWVTQVLWGMMWFNISSWKAPEKGEGPSINCVCAASSCPRVLVLKVFCLLGNHLKACRFIRVMTISANSKEKILMTFCKTLILHHTEPWPFPSPFHPSHSPSSPLLSFFSPLFWSLLLSSLPSLLFLLAAWRLALLKIDWWRAFSRVARRRGKFWQAGVKWKEGLGGHSVERSQWGTACVCAHARVCTGVWG